MDSLKFTFLAFVVLVCVRWGRGWGIWWILHVYFVLKCRILIEYVHVSNICEYEPWVHNIYYIDTTLFLYLHLCLPMKL